MKAKDILTITSTALATASLTALTFWSPSTEADGDSQAIQIANPKLVAKGVEVTLATAGGKAFKAGEQPSFELIARNTSAEAADVAVRVAMSASSPRDMLSRVPRIPAMLWQEQVTLALKPNETKTITVSSGAKLPDNQHISVWLQSADEAQKLATGSESNLQRRSPLAKPLGSGIVAMNFSTAPGTQQPLADPQPGARTN